MATIRKQSLYSSIIIYMGFAIGAFNVLYLFPKFFTPEQFGLTRIIMDITLIFSTVITAGILPIIYKFSPFYKSYLPKEKNDLTSIVFIYLAIALVIFFIALPYLKPIILRKFGKNINGDGLNNVRPIINRKFSAVIDNANTNVNSNNIYKGY
jgi:O-antigen/teichoic acid export membrane protein